MPARWLPPALLAQAALGAFDLSRGADLVVKDSGTSHVSVAHFTEEAGVVCYADWANSGKGTCNLLTLPGGNGSALASGPDVVVTESSALYVAISHFSGSAVVVCYVDIGNEGRGTCTALRLSGGVLEKGEDLVMSETAKDVTFISVSRLDQAAGVMCYSDTASSIYGACTCNALFLSGSALSKSDALVVNDAFASYISLTRSSDSSAVACYSDDGVVSYSRCSMLELQGSSLTKGPVFAVADTSSSYVSVAGLSDSAAVVCYANPPNATEGSQFGICSSLALLGQTISEGESTVVNEAATAHLSVASLSTTEAIVCYLDGGNGNVGTCTPLGSGGHTGLALTPGESLAVTDGAANFVSVAGFSDSAGVLCYSGRHEHAMCSPLTTVAWSVTETSSSSSTTLTSTTSPHTTTDTSTEFTRSDTSTTTVSATWGGMTAGLVTGDIEIAVSRLPEFVQDAGARAGVFLAITGVAGVPDSHINFEQSVARAGLGAAAAARRLSAPSAAPLRVGYEILVPPGAPGEIGGDAVRDRLAAASLAELTFAVESKVNELATAGPYDVSVTGLSEPGVRLIPVSAAPTATGDATSASPRRATPAALLMAALLAAALPSAVGALSR